MNCNEAGNTSYEDEEVVGLDGDHVVQWDKDKAATYTSGETLVEWGVHNLRAHELARVGVTREQWAIAIAAETGNAHPLKFD